MSPDVERVLILVGLLSEQWWTAAELAQALKQPARRIRRDLAVIQRLLPVRAELVRGRRRFSMQIGPVAP